MDVQTAIREGVEHLRRGDIVGAADHLKAAFDAGASDIAGLTALGYCARALARHELAFDVADRILKLDPLHIEAMLIKADALKAQGRLRLALGFFNGAVRAAAAGAQVSSDLVPEIERARRECDAAARDLEGRLRERVRRLGVADGRGRSRIERSIDVMLGKKPVYFQDPQKFFFPELPHIQFYERDQFPWAEEVEAGFDAILADLRSIEADEDCFEPYVQHNAKAAINADPALQNNKSWSAFHLIRDGTEMPENMRRCAATLKALAPAPIPKLRDLSPAVVFCACCLARTSLLIRES